MRNIINTKKIDEHNVSPYKFKVLGGMSIEEDSEDETYVQENSTEFHKEQAVNDVETIPTVQTKKEDEENKKFIEELLKKTDELSSSMIKMQMQMEKQESEFSTRLQNELQREAEASFQKGYNQAKEDLETSVNEIKNKYVNSIDNLEKEIEKSNEYFKKIEQELSSTALEIAKEVILKEVSSSSSAVAVALSRELINDLKDGKNIEIKVNPKDAETLKEEYKSSEHIKISSDSAIAEGGVIVLSDVGNLDGNIPVRIEKVKHLIQNN